MKKQKNQAQMSSSSQRGIHNLEEQVLGNITGGGGCVSCANPIKAVQQTVKKIANAQRLKKTEKTMQIPPSDRYPLERIRERPSHESAAVRLDETLTRIAASKNK
jgi:hypothetical protein